MSDKVSKSADWWSGANHNDSAAYDRSGVSRGATVLRDVRIVSPSLFVTRSMFLSF